LKRLLLCKETLVIATTKRHEKENARLTKKNNNLQILNFIGLRFLTFFVLVLQLENEKEVFFQSRFEIIKNPQPFLLLY
jgi:hypothetical protein